MPGRNRNRPDYAAVQAGGGAPEAPTVTSQPEGGEYDGETAVTLTVVATGTAPLTYQWYIGASGTTDTPVEGATSASYGAEPEENTSYWCRVSNAAGSADSNAAEVTVPVPTVWPIGAYYEAA